MNHLISTILAFGPYISSLIWICKLEIMKKSGWIWSTTKKSWKIWAKNRTNRAKNAETQTFHIFHDFLAVQILSFHVFLWSPCHRIISECEIIVWGWEPVRYTRLSAHRTPALWFWHFWFAGRLKDIVGHYGKVSSGISQLCHSRCAVYFNTIEPALFAQSASGYFSSSGQKYWFRLKIQPESIQTIIMAWGFRRYVR